MAYFSFFPKFKHKNTDGTITEIVDITRRVGISEKMQANIAAFRTVQNPSSERPDIMAYRAYEEASLVWIPFFMNDVIDPMYDWVLDDTSFEEYLSIKYPGSTFFVDYTDTRDVSSSSSSSPSSASTEVSATSSSENRTSSSESSATLSTSSSSSNSSSSTNSSSSSLSTDSLSSSSSSPSSSSSLSSSSTQGEATSQSSLSSSSTDNSYSSQTSSGSTISSVSSSSSSTPLSSSSNTNSISSSSSQEISNFIVGETVNLSDSRTGVVYAWEPTYRRLTVTGISTPDTVVDLEDTIIQGITSGAMATIRRAIPESKFALHHFEGSITDDAGNVLFTNVVLDPRDYIEGFINRAETNLSVSNFQYEYDLNETKRDILLPRKEYADEFKRQLRINLA